MQKSRKHFFSFVATVYLEWLSGESVAFGAVDSGLIPS